MLPTDPDLRRSATVRPASELTWVGQGGWIACDPTAAVDDPSRVLAYVECRDGHVYVTWLADPGSVAEYASLRDALREIDARLA